jgi:hypothetical protein
VVGGRGVFQESDGSGKRGDEMRLTLIEARYKFEIPEVGIQWIRSHSTDKHKDSKIKEGPIGKLETQIANTFVTAWNACHSINPDNPQAVAEAIGEMWVALERIAKLDASDCMRDDSPCMGAQTASSIAHRVLQKVRG